ncbi:MAG: FHA domain-containing protein [Desulfuromonadales bacterium]
MQCAFCRESIDDDSKFCDQCGEEVRRCPSCGTIGKGKVCTKCGTKFTPIIAPADFQQIINDGASQPVPSASQAPQSTVRVSDPASSPTVLELRLVNKTLNLDIRILDRSIIGRATGEYVSIFGSHGQVSGRHCRFDFERSAGWSITDLGSTNGTKYDNQPLVPNAPRQLGDHHRLQIANIEFIVRVIPL